MQNTIIKSIVSLGLSCLSLSVLAAAVPQQPVDKNQCFGCHATAIKTLSTRGAHKNVNCMTSVRTTSRLRAATTVRPRILNTPPVVNATPSSTKTSWIRNTTMSGHSKTRRPLMLSSVISPATILSATFSSVCRASIRAS